MRQPNFYKPEDQLCRYIDEAGIRRSWVASRAGMRYDSLCKSLQGRRALKADELLCLMQVLDLGPEDFLQREATEL